MGAVVFFTGVFVVRSEAERQAGTAMMNEGLEVSRRLCDEGLIAEVLATLSLAAEWTGDRVGAVRCAEEALEIGRSLADDRLIGNAAGALGLAATGQGKKKQLLTEALTYQRRAGDLSRCCWWLVNLAALELADENSQTAAELLEEDLAICGELDLPVDLRTACCALADTTLFEGSFEEAAIWLRRVVVSYRRLGQQDAAVADFPNVICCVARLGNPGTPPGWWACTTQWCRGMFPWSTRSPRRTPLRTCNSFAKSGLNRLSRSSARLSVMTTSSCSAVPG